MLAAWRGEAGRVAPGRGAAWPGCPYLGLVPFGEEDARVYYGRGELVAGLVRRLAEHAVRAAAGRGAEPGPGGPTGATAPPCLVLVIDQLEELFTPARAAA